jgi:hypothetical protein
MLSNHALNQTTRITHTANSISLSTAKQLRTVPCFVPNSLLTANPLFVRSNSYPKNPPTASLIPLTPLSEAAIYLNKVFLATQTSKLYPPTTLIPQPSHPVLFSLDIDKTSNFFSASLHCIPPEYFSIFVSSQFFERNSQ